MAQPPKKTPDRHYDFGRMNMIFAWSSIGLLAVTLWMVFADYAKPWKRLQAEFRGLERQKLVSEAETERQRLNENELAAAREQLAAEEASLAAQRDEIEETEKRLIAIDKKLYAADARSRTTKSQLDTLRYQLDQASQSGDAERLAEARARVEEYAERFREDRIALEELTAAREAAAAELEHRRAGKLEAEERLKALRTGVDNLEKRSADLAKRLDYFLLNAPLLDVFEPNLKIDQVILSGLYQNINFTNVDRVDRCVTCHVASNRSGFDDESWEEPFRSHPRLDLYLSSSSPHPYERFGCTTCHGGLDRATDFARAGHSPRSEEQRAEWEKEWDWKPQKYLDTPILPGGYSEAGCVGCHAGNVWTPSSELQDVGRELVSRMACYSCHKIDYPAFTGLPRPGPTLTKVASKTTPEWAYRWIEAPRDFHPTTFMPHFFFQENIEGELNEERQRAEIASTVAYIWDNSEVYDYPPPPPGDSERGRELFESVGCLACHVQDAEATRDDFYPQINRLHGPNLIRTGSKVSPGWLYAWIRDPKAYNPETRMPDLRLTDREAADIVAYLLESRDPAFENLEMPQIDGAVRDELVVGYLQNTQTIEQSQASLEAMSDRERDVYLGENTIRKYGCFGCHNLEGFEDAKPIGVELTEEGSKPLHQFDFGHVHDVPHTRHDWIRTKVLRPRIWDEGKELTKDYHELYKMPNFGMSEREARAVTTNVLGFTKESVVTSRKADQAEGADAIAAGRKLITRLNCQGCHLLEGKGHAIASALDNVDLLPPNLAAQGARVRSEWLFDYLHDPSSETMRPWLEVRMPTFEFSDDEVNALIAYFSTRDDTEPFLSAATPPDERSRAVGEVTFNMLQCAKCHPAGPAAAAGGVVSAGELAPSLLLAEERLRQDWVPDWIKDPQSWVPGTKMPSNFAKSRDGSYDSPLDQAIDAPMFESQKQRLMRHFDSEEELKAFLGDVDRVTVALRDHIWWNLR